MTTTVILTIIAITGVLIAVYYWIRFHREQDLRKEYEFYNDDYKIKNEVLEAKNKQLKTENENLVKENIDYADEYKRLLEYRDDLNNQIKDLKLQINSSGLVYQKASDEKDKTIERLSNELNTIKVEKVALENQVNELILKQNPDVKDGKFIKNQPEGLNIDSAKLMAEITKPLIPKARNRRKK